LPKLLIYELFYQTKYNYFLGVASEVKGRALDLIRAGVTPAKVVEAVRNDVHPGRLPTRSDIVSLKKSVKVSEKSKFHVENNQHLLVFLNKYILSRMEFDALTDLDRMIVLKTFEYEVTTDSSGETVKHFGFTFSSKRLLMNGYKAYVANNREGIILNTDGTHTAYFFLFTTLTFSAHTYRTGTYKLVHSGWPLLVLGTDQCLDKSYSTHSMIPIVLAFTRSESQRVYEELMRSYPDAMSYYFDVNEPLHVVGGVCDHADSIA